MRKFFFLCACAIAFSTASPTGAQPRDGYVPNAKTATSIAIAVLSPIYGETYIQKQKPFVTTLKNDIWHVRSALKKSERGGGFLIDIAKKDGRILRVVHFQ